MQGIKKRVEVMESDTGKSLGVFGSMTEAADSLYIGRHAIQYALKHPNANTVYKVRLVKDVGYIVYEVRDLEGCLVMKGCASEVATFLNISKAALYSNYVRKIVMQEKYRIFKHLKGDE